MKRFNILFIVLMVFAKPYSGFAQQEIHYKDKWYSATNDFYLSTPSGYNSSIWSNLKLCIVNKGDNTGLIVLTLEGNYCIRGTATIVLDSKEIITLVDRKNYDAVDNTVSTIYSLSSADISKLSKSNIYKVRFTTVDCKGYELNSNRNYTAENDGYASTLSNRDVFRQLGVRIERVDFPKIITALYEVK